jgi:GNAT superfamily N-acetyltransferase
MQTTDSSHPANEVPGGPSWTEQLSDGASVLIRPIRSEDAAAERAFIEALSPEARRNRFLGQVAHPSEAMIRHFVDLDYVHDLGFVAVIQEDGKDVILGVSRYSTGDGSDSCECAISVLDAWQGRGLGTALMKHLIEVARSRGITRMWSMDAAENAKMRDLAHHLGFERKPDPDNPSQVLHTLML